MDVQSQIIEDVVSALNTGSFLSFGLLEEQLNAGLKFAVEPSELAMHHHQNFIVVLHPKRHFLEGAKRVSE